MRKALMEQYKELIQQHEATLAAAEKRGSDSDAAARHLDETLGESERRRLLAHTGLRSLEEAVEKTTVIRRNKRSALLQIGDLFAIAGRFGVIAYHLPSSVSIGSFNLSVYTVYGIDKAILDKIGAVVDGRDGPDCVYNYQAA